MKSYRPTKSYIELDNLVYNYNMVVNKSGAEVLAVVKADAYGHGAVMCAKELISAGASYLAVAAADEAVELRCADIDCSILILTYVPYDALDELMKYDFTYTVYDIEFAVAINRAAIKSGMKQRIHIKCDTGMGRLGFCGWDEISEALEAISNMKHIIIEGIFTHLSTAEEEDTKYSRSQIEKFKHILKKAENMGFLFKYRHIANSAASVRYNNDEFNMVRPGLILYGMYPSQKNDDDEYDIKPVMSLRTVIAQLRKFDSGKYISYNRTYVTKDEEVLAALPLGYADGYPRALSGKGNVIIKGRKCPVVGRICMDQTVVNATAVMAVKGDEVILIGENLSAEDVAAAADTINYEITTRIGRRVPRLYYRDGELIDTINYLLK